MRAGSLAWLAADWPCASAASACCTRNLTMNSCRAGAVQPSGTGQVAVPQRQVQPKLRATSAHLP
jgi:hypothetical protein